MRIEIGLFWLCLNGKAQHEKHNCKLSAKGDQSLSSTKYIETQCVYSRNLGQTLLTERLG